MFVFWSFSCKKTFFQNLEFSVCKFDENKNKNLFKKKFTFNTVTLQIFSQEFYLDFKTLLLLHFRFPRASIFQNTSFSHLFMMAGSPGKTRQLTRSEPMALLILFTFLGCLRLPESSIKILGVMLMG